ncbi:rhodanese-like domain-containing protein chloroplastic-like, partial [Trifolium pratense]
SEAISLSGAHALAPVALFTNKTVAFQFQKPFFFKFNFNNSFSSTSLIHRNPLAAQLQPSCSTEDDFDFDFLVVNFYHFVFIKDPQQEVAKHLSFLELEGLDIHGRIYLNEQGINAQYSGPSKDAMVYVNWIKEDDRFSNILVQISQSEIGHAFPSLKLRCPPFAFFLYLKFKSDTSDLPVLDPSMRAIPLAPSEWRDRLEAINKNDLHSKDYPNKDYILLDVRNDYVALESNAVC